MISELHMSMRQSVKEDRTLVISYHRNSSTTVNRNPIDISRSLEIYSDGHVHTVKIRDTERTTKSWGGSSDILESRYVGYLTEKLKEVMGNCISSEGEGPNEYMLEVKFNGDWKSIRLVTDESGNGVPKNLGKLVKKLERIYDRVPQESVPY